MSLQKAELASWNPFALIFPRSAMIFKQIRQLGASSKVCDGPQVLQYCRGVI